MPNRAHAWGIFRPLRVRAHLSSPVAIVPGEPLLPLDAILEYAAFKAGNPPVFRPPGSHGLARIDGPDPANFLIPLKREGHRDSPDWFWRASWATFPEGFTLDVVHWSKRFDGADPLLTEFLTFGSRRGNTPITAGRYKSYHMPVVLAVAPCLEWHCVGGAAGVSRLLPAITHLGHKRGQGHGEVLRWEVWPATLDLSLFSAQGNPARALPLSWLGGEGRPPLPDTTDTALVSIRAPSWHAARRRECAIPPAPQPTLG